MSGFLELERESDFDSDFESDFASGFDSVLESDFDSEESPDFEPFSSELLELESFSVALPAELPSDEALEEPFFA